MEMKDPTPILEGTFLEIECMCSFQDRFSFMFSLKSFRCYDLFGLF